MSRDDTLKIVHLPNGGRIEYYTVYESLDWIDFHNGFYGNVNYRDTFDEKGNHVRRVTNGWWWVREYDDEGRKIYQSNSDGHEVYFGYYETEFGYASYIIDI